jgi:hypothetical protein
MLSRNPINSNSKAIAYHLGGDQSGSKIWLSPQSLDMTAQERKQRDLSDLITIEELHKRLRQLCRSRNTPFKVSDYKLNQEEYNEINGRIYTPKKYKNSPSNKITDIIDCLDVDTEFYTVEDSLLQQLPPLDSNDRAQMFIYICGPSMSGKSYYCSNLIKEYKKQNPDNKILLFSDTKKDPHLDSLVKRITLGDELLNMELDCGDMHDMLIIFDDCDSITNKPLKKKIGIFRDQILNKGRHSNISCIITNHALTNYAETRTVLMACPYIVLFPQSSAKKNIEYCLTNYYNCSKENVDLILRMPSRWIMVYKNYPRYAMSQSTIVLL